MLFHDPYQIWKILSYSEQQWNISVRVNIVSDVKYCRYLKGLIIQFEHDRIQTFKSLLGHQDVQAEVSPSKDKFVKVFFFIDNKSHKNIKTNSDFIY